MADHESNPAIISRKEAEEKGLERYFTGVPCGRGHLCERYVNGRRCILCALESNRRVKNITTYRKESTDSIIRSIKLGERKYFTGLPCKRGHIAERYASTRECVICAKEIRKAARRLEANKERNRISQREFYQKNRVLIINKYKEKRNLYSKKPESKEKAKLVQANFRKRHQNNPQVKLAFALRNRLKAAIRGGAKSGSAVGDLGCTIEYFKYHMERQFQKGMTWSNMGKKWHIDHIMPLSAFDLTDRQQLLEACNYRNLQPSWREDNLQKHNKHPIDFAQSRGLLL